MGKSSFTEEETAAGRDWENLPSESGAAAHTDVVTGTGLDNGGEYVLVYPGPDQIAATAKALNDAARGREQQITWSDGAFRVPKDIADAADLPGEADAVIQPRGGSTSSLNGAEGDLNGEHTAPAGSPSGAPSADGGTGEPEADDEFRDMTVAELHDYAEKNKIDLGGATKKADIKATLRAHKAQNPGE